MSESDDRSAERLKHSKAKAKGSMTNVNLPSAKALKLMPDLQREAELEAVANEINSAHQEIQDNAETVLRAGTAAIQRAIDCGHWLRDVKEVVGHGNFEDWCGKHLKFKIRKAQYYMLLARTYAAKDVEKLNPQSLRQALLYAGALPLDPERKRRPVSAEKCSGLRRAVSRLMSQLRAQIQLGPEELLRELEPLFQWRADVLAARQGAADSTVIVDVPAVASTDPQPNLASEQAKTQHDASLSSGSGGLSVPAVTNSAADKNKSAEQEPANRTTRKSAALLEYRRGDPVRHIARRHGVASSTIVRWARSEGLPPRLGSG